MLRLGKWIALGSVAFASFSAQAASWALDEDASSVHFVTVKNAVIAETHEFLEISGAVAAEEAAVSIALGSVETLIAIRNERMREMLFEVANYPKAILTAPVAQGDGRSAGAGGERRAAPNGHPVPQGRGYSPGILRACLSPGAGCRARGIPWAGDGERGAAWARSRCGSPPGHRGAQQHYAHGSRKLQPAL